MNIHGRMVEVEENCWVCLAAEERAEARMRMQVLTRSYCHVSALSHAQLEVIRQNKCGRV